MRKPYLLATMLGASSALLSTCLADSLPHNVLGSFENGAPPGFSNSLDDRVWFKDMYNVDLGHNKELIKFNWGLYFSTSHGLLPLELGRAPAPFIIARRDEDYYIQNHKHAQLPYPDYYKYPGTHYRIEYQNEYPYSSYLKSRASKYPLQTIQTGYTEVLPKTNIYPQGYALGQSTRTITLGSHSLVTTMRNLEVDFLATGTRELNAYMNELASNHKSDSLQSMPSSKACTKSDMLELTWEKDQMVSDTNQTIAMALAKLTRPSTMDYNLNLAEYVKGKVLYVSTEGAKDRLEKVLKQNHIKTSVQLVSSKGYSPKVPLDGTYFAVERNKDEMESAESDYWGYDPTHADFYKYRYGYINDVRFNANLLKRKPIDGFFQEIAKQRGVENCRLSLIR